MTSHEGWDRGCPGTLWGTPPNSGQGCPGTLWGTPPNSGQGCPNGEPGRHSRSARRPGLRSLFAGWGSEAFRFLEGVITYRDRPPARRRLTLRPARSAGARCGALGEGIPEASSPPHSHLAAGRRRGQRPYRLDSYHSSFRETNRNGTPAWRRALIHARPAGRKVDGGG